MKKKKKIIPHLLKKYIKLNKLLFVFLVVLFFLCLSIVTIIAARKHACQSWENGWNAWKEEETEKALSHWSKYRFTSKFVRRPARNYYWRSRALEKLGRELEADKIKSELFRKYPFDFYTFMLHPDTESLFSDKRLEKAKLFFPRPWKEEVAAAADITDLPKSLIWAIMKRESKFLNGVVSKAGAVGLMQLMPMTAHSVAEQMGLKTQNISNPEDNIMIGAGYYAILEKKFHGELLRIAAAYNAGETVVARWGTLDSVDWAEWVENIPYSETREFVRSVLENRELYKLIYKEDNYLALYEIIKNPLTATTNCASTSKIIRTKMSE